MRFMPQTTSNATKKVLISFPEQLWDGMSKDEFLEVKQKIQENRSRDTIFVLVNTCRIHLSQVHTWESEGFLPSGSFSRSLGRLRKIYWGEETPPKFTQNKIALHARRGDVANPSHYLYNVMGPGTWSLELYSDLIDKIKARKPDHKITIFSEIKNSEDLKNLEGVDLELGGAENLLEHFHKMVTAEYFVPCCSSLSTWASYLSQGTVLMPGPYIKHFDHPALLPNWRPIQKLSD